MTAGLAAASVVIVLCAFLLSRPDNSAQNAVEETRRALRRQGFKTDLSEFDFSASEELRAFATALTNATLLTHSRNPAAFNHRSVLMQSKPDLMTAVGANAAVVVWKQGKLPDRSGEDLWPVLRAALGENHNELDAACRAALSGPIRFDLNARAGTGMLLPHLAALKTFAQTLETRAVLDLHDGNRDAAWTNLLALTRLATAYDPESVEITHLVRYACAAIAYNVSWQALQAGGWQDDRLAHLQKEWESVDFFRGLPETVAFTRASVVAACQLERQQPMTGLGMTLQGTLRSPRSAWSALIDYRRRLRYRHHGTYEDEKSLLLHYRDRELELRRAVQSPTWSVIRALPGVTNRVPFQSRHHSVTVDLMNVRQVMLASHLQAQRYGLLGRAAEAESRRRLILTAIALENYRNRHGSYPNTLQELAPNLLKNPPVDFVDGQPLRYRRTDGGRFVLHSAGLDCTDNGGQMQRNRRPGVSDYGVPGFGIQPGTDLVWPCPASEAEIQAHEEEEERTRQENRQAMLTAGAEAEKEAAFQRERTLVKLEQLYAKQQPRKTREPTYQGQPLSKVLRNAKVSGNASLTLDELLTVKQITTGEEPDIATFEVPISYDVVTNIGSLHLLVDADPEADSNSDGGELQECNRSTNGNCLLVWNTTYDPPGKHFVQAKLLYEEKEESSEIKGPLVPFFSTNVCQFDPFYSQFDSTGAILYAKLPESNGIYTIELKSPAGVHVRTFTGSTSNGVIHVHWDLTADNGKTYTNDSVDSVFHVTLPDSGRSQTLKGP